MDPLEARRLELAQAQAEAHVQADAWDNLAGRWRSDLDPGEEIDRILESRTRGRPMDL